MAEPSQSSGLQTRLQAVFDGVLSNAVFAVIVAMGAGIWAAIQDAPGYVIALAALWAVVGVLLLLRLIAWLLSLRKPTHVPTGLGVAYPCRRSFPEFKEKLKASSEVWAYWHTAGNFVMNPQSFKDVRSLKMLVLIAPTNLELDELARITKVGSTDLRSQILRATTLARGANCMVKWWYGHITDNVTIGNPNVPKTWCEIEALMPSVDATSRAKMEFQRDIAPAKCDELQKWFTDIWLNQELCREPDSTR